MINERVPPALDGERIDRVVSMLTGLARSDAAHMVDDGRVCIGGRSVHSRGRRVHTGEVLDLDVPGATPVEAVVADPTVGVVVVWVDDALIVVDKPAGLVVHPGAGNTHGTLVQGLLAAFPDLWAMAVGEAAARPGVVQRLDKGTSGLLVVARSEDARRSLVAQLGDRAVERRYRALVAGTVEAGEGLIDAPLGRAGTDPTRITVAAGGREARTRYRVDARYRHPIDASLLECRLETGRTHQIRVHLAAIGHSLIGDDRYGGPILAPKGPAGRGAPPARPFLHAAVLGFDHPVTGERLRFESPLPPDLVAILEAFSA
ncbi:MAG TPA: RluA family pseudouridine synthase [Acidimicrobiales bacterium]|jgi:23S rRNA pseudouridine1911/1915/1917 synthase|nr:RluA family pseudouridine synthase [Acidimicrobiales bacterium]